MRFLVRPERHDDCSCHHLDREALGTTAFTRQILNLDLFQDKRGCRPSIISGFSITRHTL